MRLPQRVHVQAQLASTSALSLLQEMDLQRAPALSLHCAAAGVGCVDFDPHRRHFCAADLHGRLVEAEARVEHTASPRLLMQRGLAATTSHSCMLSATHANRAAECIVSASTMARCKGRAELDALPFFTRRRDRDSTAFLCCRLATECW